MDPGDLIFYGIIAISVISSIAKAVKKKSVADADTAMPDFKGSPQPKNIFKTILEELEKDDDFIPSNPKPVQPTMTAPIPKLKVKPMHRVDMAANYEKGRIVAENTSHRTSLNNRPTVETEEKTEDVSDPILNSLDLKQTDELKRAIIYSEIIRPKF